jgi:RecA/RadA recombinase
VGAKAKDNPFASEKVEQLKFIPTATSVDKLTQMLPEVGFRCAIAGPHGSGKTTLMLEISNILQAGGHIVKHIFVNDTNPMTTEMRDDLIANLQAGEIVLFDGADLIGRIAWQKLKRSIFKAKAGLIITTHKRGMMDTVAECSTSPQLLKTITNTLLADHETLNDQLIDEIYARHNGNIRNCLWQMYDFWSGKGRPGLTST